MDGYAEHSIERNGQHSLRLDAFSGDCRRRNLFSRYPRRSMTSSYSLRQRKVDQNEIDHTHQGQQGNCPDRRYFRRCERR